MNYSPAKIHSASVSAKYGERYAVKGLASSAGGSGGGGKKEVIRENVPSCADAGHGTTYITYLDGSVKVVGY